MLFIFLLIFLLIFPFHLSPDLSFSSSHHSVIFHLHISFSPFSRLLVLRASNIKFDYHQKSGHNEVIFDEIWANLGKFSGLGNIHPSALKIAKRDNLMFVRTLNYPLLQSFKLRWWILANLEYFAQMLSVKFHRPAHQKIIKGYYFHYLLDPRVAFGGHSVMVGVVVSTSGFHCGSNPRSGSEIWCC